MNNVAKVCENIIVGKFDIDKNVMDELILGALPNIKLFKNKNENDSSKESVDFNGEVSENNIL